ncbi:hypothetical protein BKI52_21960 [marine bacterium AO1-C]|nr:hypothetical protein BKI52_21960 [marine bacterium AO1-C]
MRYVIIFIGILLLSVQDGFGTAQIPDYIIYKGEKYFLHSNPLEKYFAKYPNKRPQSKIRSTGLWRGYKATFKIQDETLLVKDIEIQVQVNGDYKWRSVIQKVFPNKASRKLLWYKGILVMPHGKMINYVHMGYGSTYEKYTLLEIKEGKLKRTKRMNYKKYSEFKQKQFEAFKKTKKYQQLVKDLQKDGDYGLEFIDSFLKNAIINYTAEFLDD